MKQELYLDDVNVGDTFISETYHLNPDKIKRFASEFDPQDFHLDETLAEDTFFNGLAASGWHTAAITMRLLTSSLPFAHGVIGAGGEIKWPRPTRPNDILYVRSTIKEIKPSKSKPNQALLSVESETLNQRDEVCQNLTSKLLSFRKS
ncbi:MaoC family dehydratase [Virgibacillus sp. NKC19-16]|uniref:MaoC family dehydratase n=1 Tax=Virgibacillus salidurans TaxID=2831673 RepID=UPI001F353262|nr:MaoC family dehydratase [Virgibacillus sp. NKC19-16]UJL46657.1 MaoC family dehydratase [Virgibacillus sp. NKC19-16]